MLVDTSVWVDHLRSGDHRLQVLLLHDQVECHPFVIGELACGRLNPRPQILAMLGTLPQLPVAEHDEVLIFIETNRLAGSGIGWLDAHLLSSAVLASAGLWTRDARMAAVARRIGVYAEP